MRRLNGGPGQSGAESLLQIPGYRLLGSLARGGMGEVMLAERSSDAGVPVRCVVKTVLESLDGDPAVRALFLDEARTCAQLRHPNVVSIMDVGTAGDRLFLVMEWVDGTDAGRLIDLVGALGTEIPLKHVLYIVREALQGLHHAHTATGADGLPLGIVHRDISPGNLLISRQGAVKLADFGVALGKTGRRRADPGQVAGKPQYHAPELFDGAPASVQTDLFAMGVSFYELLSSRRLFDPRLDRRQLADTMRGFSPRELLDRDLTVPDGLEPVLLRALDPHPRDRYQAALEFLEDINDFAYESGIRLLDAHFASFVGRLLREAPA